MVMVLKNIIILLSRLNRAPPEPVEASPEPVEGSAKPKKTCILGVFQHPLSPKFVIYVG